MSVVCAMAVCGVPVRQHVINESMPRASRHGERDKDSKSMKIKAYRQDPMQIDANQSMGDRPGELRCTNRQGAQTDDGSFCFKMGHLARSHHPAQNAIRMQSPYNENAISMQSECNQNVITVYQNCKENAIGMQSKCNQNAISMRSACSQNAISMQSECNQNAIRM